MLVQTHLEGKIKDIRVEIGNLRVSMAWSTVGVATLLRGLITLFKFLSRKTEPGTPGIEAGWFRFGSNE